MLAFVAAPLHAFALPREHFSQRQAPSDAPATTTAPALLPASGLAFFLVAAGFAIYAFVPSGLAAHMLAMFGRAGIDRNVAVMIGALFGPSQVSARFCEFLFAGNVHPLLIARFALGLMLAGFVLLASSDFPFRSRSCSRSCSARQTG